MKRVYYLSYLEWRDGMNVGRCHSFEASTDAEARSLAAEHLAGIETRPSRDGLKPDTGTTSWHRLRCATERAVRL